MYYKLVTGLWKRKSLYPHLKLSQDDKQIANVVVPFGGGEEVSFLLEEENGYPHQIDKSKLTSPNINVCLDLCSHTSNFRSSQIIQNEEEEDEDCGFPPDLRRIMEREERETKPH